MGKLPPDFGVKAPEKPSAPGCVVIRDGSTGGVSTEPWERVFSWLAIGVVAIGIAATIPLWFPFLALGWLIDKAFGLTLRGSPTSPRSGLHGTWWPEPKTDPPEAPPSPPPPGHGYQPRRPPGAPDVKPEDLKPPSARSCVEGPDGPYGGDWVYQPRPAD